MTLRDRLTAAGTSVAVGGLAAHLVLTAIDNLPDQHVSVRRLLPWAGEMPTWRFFGPNPGVDDIHLMVRPGRDGTPVGEWDEIDLRVNRPWWAPLWNPGTRGPKTLFDATQQVKQSSVDLDGDFDRLVTTPAYRLLADYVVASAPRHHDADEVQFMLLTSRPMPETSELRPVLISTFLPRAAGRGGGATQVDDRAAVRVDDRAAEATPG